MIGKSIQFNRRNGISVLLAVVMVILATTPALAWFDEGSGNGQVAGLCHVISDGLDAPRVYCDQVTPGHAHPVVEQALGRPAITRAEQQELLFEQVSIEPLVQSTSDQ